MPLVSTGAKPLKLPPETSMSLAIKLVLGSDSVKVMVSVLVTTPVPLRSMAMVGAVVSGTRVLKFRLTWLLVSNVAPVGAGLT